MEDGVEAENRGRMTHPLHEVLEALEGVVRVADRATVEFDAARAAISKVRLLLEEKNQPLSHPAATNRTLPAAPQLDTPCAIEAERAPVRLPSVDVALSMCREANQEALLPIPMCWDLALYVARLEDFASPLKEPGKADGWQLVPCDPPMAMLEAGIPHALRCDDDDGFRPDTDPKMERYRAIGQCMAIYKDMLAASPVVHPTGERTASIEGPPVGPQATVDGRMKQTGSLKEDQ